MQVIGFFRVGENRGYFSNWYLSDFQVGGIVFHSAEQYLMYMKASTFGDIDIANRILDTYDQHQIKALGRRVKNYDDSVWSNIRQVIMEKGLYAKFSQNERLKAHLLATGDNIIAECSPYDVIWGIGLSTGDPRHTNPAEWKGQNLLGKALMTVRDQIRDEMGIINE